MTTTTSISNCFQMFSIRLSRLARPYSTARTALPKFIFSKAVADALATQKPVVALESTIITHGMPFPQNLETARQVEDIVRSTGATPATIAILDGKVHIGLDNVQLEQLAELGPRVKKTARRDLSFVCSQGISGATTVSSTMMLAHRAGIKMFVTGGIGGVHRGAESTMDISSDLTELGRTPVAVVCAGVKSILDVGRTLEFLVRGMEQGVMGVGDARRGGRYFWRRRSIPRLFHKVQWLQGEVVGVRLMCAESAGVLDHPRVFQAHPYAFYVIKETV
jgi:pseudouridine-5'-phosphate glycosidase